MNNFIRGKYRFVGMLLAVFTSVATLQASPNVFVKKEDKKHTSKKSPTQRTQFTSLSLNLETLKELGPQFQGPKNIPLSKMIGEVIDDAQDVVNKGSHADPFAVKKSLNSVKKLLDFLKQKQIRLKEHYSSISSIGIDGCDVCSELSHLESEVSKCCKAIKAQIYDLLRYLKEEFPCDSPTPISCVPYTITESGKYCVTCDLVYNGTMAAITVAADNVTLNFHNHSLTINQPGAQGVKAENVSEFVLENDIIKGASPFKTATSAAVWLVNVEKATLSNIYTFNTTKGVKIENSTDVRIENSLMQWHEGLSMPTTATIGAGVWIDTSIAVTIDGCTFVGAALEEPLPEAEASNALYVQGASEAITVKNSNFNNWLSTITLNQVTGVLIENCEAVASSLSANNLLQVGSMEQQANDIIIRNTTFRQATQVPGFDGLFFLNGSGCLMENVIVDVATVNDGDDNPYFPGAIHIGCAVNGHVSCDPYLAYSNILAKSCIVKGQNEYGLFVENGSFITFVDSQFRGASLVNVYLNGAVDPDTHESLYGAYGCVIQDSTITDATGTGQGVLINSGADANAVIKNDISHNGNNGLVIAQYAYNNHINGNSVFGNGSYGIENLDVTTATYFNISCNNAADNCIGVVPEQPPGFTPSVAGSNICCTP